MTLASPVVYDQAKAGTDVVLTGAINFPYIKDGATYWKVPIYGLKTKGNNDNWEWGFDASADENGTKYSLIRHAINIIKPANGDVIVEDGYKHGNIAITIPLGAANGEDYYIKGSVVKKGTKDIWFAVWTDPKTNSRTYRSNEKDPNWAEYKDDKNNFETFGDYTEFLYSQDDVDDAYQALLDDGEGIWVDAVPANLGSPAVPAIPATPGIPAHYEGKIKYIKKTTNEYTWTWSFEKQ